MVRRYYYPDYLIHHGVKGMRWGVRHDNRVQVGKTQSRGGKKFKLTDKQKATAKKVAIGAAVVAGVGLTAYGGYKLQAVRSANKAVIGQYLSKNYDIANSVVSGGKVYSSPYAIRVPKYASGISYGGSTLSRGTISNSIKGPTLRTTRSSVNSWYPKGSEYKSVSKTLEMDRIGAKGRGKFTTMTKDDKKRYKRMYDQYYKAYKIGK